MNEEEIRKAFVKQACEYYNDSPDVCVDDDAKVSISDEFLQAGGAYVQAWVWVPTPDSLKERK